MILKNILIIGLLILSFQNGFGEKAHTKRLQYQSPAANTTFKKEFKRILNQIGKSHAGDKKLMSPLGLCIFSPGQGAYSEIDFSGIKKEQLSDNSFFSKLLKTDEGKYFVKDASSYAIPALTSGKDIDRCNLNKAGSFFLTGLYDTIPLENGLSKTAISQVKKLQKSISKVVLLSIKTPGEGDEHDLYKVMLGFSHISGNWYLTLIDFYDCGA